MRMGSSEYARAEESEERFAERADRVSERFFFFLAEAAVARFGCRLYAEPREPPPSRRV